MIAAFMGTGTAPTNAGAASSVGVEDNIPNAAQRIRRQLSGLLGRLGGGNRGGATGIAGLLGGGGTKAEGPPESAVAASAGQGAISGLPTANADGTVDSELKSSRRLEIYTDFFVLFQWSSAKSTKTVQGRSQLMLTEPLEAQILLHSNRLR